MGCSPSRRDIDYSPFGMSVNLRVDKIEEIKEEDVKKVLVEATRELLEEWKEKVPTAPTTPPSNKI